MTPMSDLEVWISIFLLLAATVITRGSFFIFGNVRLPHKVQHALRYAPAAAMAAIVIPDLVLPGQPLAANLMNPKLLAALGATAFFLASRHLLGTIIVGMLLFTGLRLWL